MIIIDKGSSNYILSRIKEYGSGNLIVGGSYERYPVEIFSDYSDVRMLVTHIRPYNME